MSIEQKADNVELQKEQKTGRKPVSIDEKIKIFERFSKTREKLNGKTMFEGHPIGQWAIQIRNQVNRKRKLMEQKGVNISQNLTEQQQEKLEKLGILQSQKESKIDEKIQALINWNNKYPKAKCYSTRVPVEALREYSNSEEEYNELEVQYKKIQKYYKYIMERKKAGKLTLEQENTCKEANVGGIFGATSPIEALCKKYRMHQTKIEYIVNKYGEMDNFITTYRKGELDEEDKITLEHNLRSNFDINLTNNKNYDLLVKRILGHEYITEKNLNLYDIKGLNEALNTLKPREVDILKNKFNLENGTKITLTEFKEKYNISVERVRQIIVKALKRLGNASRESLFNKADLNNMHSMTPEEQAIIKEVANIIFSSNSIFYPDKEYENEPDNINSNRFLECIAELERISLNRKDKETVEQNVFNANTPIEELDFSFRTFACLKKSGINTVSELMCVTDETLTKIVRVNKKGREEIRKKLEEMAEENQQQIDSNVGMDRSIVILNLSVRTSTCLERKGIDTIEKLVSQIEGNFKNLRKISGLGKKCIEEIKEKLEHHGILLPEMEDEKEESSTYDEKLIENLGFSVRAYNCLKREGIETIPELVDRIDGDFGNLSGIKNLGQKTIEEIKIKLEQYGVLESEHTEQREEYAKKPDIKEIEGEQEKLEIDDLVTQPESDRKNSELKGVRKKKEKLEAYIKKIAEQERQAKELLAEYEKILDAGNKNRDTNPEFKDE